jgi:hypothetical protein
VKTVEVAMMMVWHTHDDIDALFALISEKLQQLGFILASRVPPGETPGPSYPAMLRSQVAASH